MTHWVNTLNRAQRIVLSIGFAVVLGGIGRFVELGGRGRVGGGWFGYAPNTSAVFIPGRPFLLRHPLLDLLWWLFIVAVWVGASLWLFARRGDQ